MRHRRGAIALLAFVVVAGCGSGTIVDSAGEVPTSGAVAREFPLLFGLQQVKGTAAVARPVVAEHVPALFAGQPVQATGLRAAYWVTGSPQEVMTAWLEQFAELGFGDIEVTTPSMLESSGPVPWLRFSTYSVGADGSYANAELWSTDADPLLLIEIDRSDDTVSVPVDTPEMPELPTAPAPVPVSLVSEGDAVFGSEGAEVHLTSGAEQVMPSVPSISGTYGEVVMLTTDDPRETVRAMVEEAYDHNEAQPEHEPGWIDGPREGELDGSMTVTAGFNSGSGGWGFAVLASKAADDEVASVWVRAYAD